MYILSGITSPALFCIVSYVLLVSMNKSFYVCSLCDYFTWGLEQKRSEITLSLPFVLLLQNRLDSLDCTYVRIKFWGMIMYYIIYEIIIKVCYMSGNVTRYV